MNVKRFSKSKKTGRKSKAPRRRGVRRFGRFGNPRSLAPVKNNYARSVETVQYEDILPNQGLVQLVNLADFPRSLALSNLYQFYRITEVKYVYEPYANVFAEGASIASTVPQMFSIMDRSGYYDTLSEPFTLNTILEQGSKPRKFTKNLTVKYKPNTLVQSAVDGTDGTVINVAPELKWNAWIATNNVITAGTNAKNVPYYGHIVWFDQYAAILDKPIGRLNVSVTVEFKQPISLDQKTPATPLVISKPVSS